MKYYIEELDSSSEWKRKGKRGFDSYAQANKHAEKKLRLSDDEHIFRIKGEETDLSSLTPKERQVLDMIVDGWENLEIAYELGIGLRTVEYRRHHIFRKMKATKLAELIRKVC